MNRCLGCLIGLGGKFYRGDRWFYKFQSTALGSSIIVPNMTLNYVREFTGRNLLIKSLTRLVIYSFYILSSTPSSQSSTFYFLRSKFTQIYILLLFVRLLIFLEITDHKSDPSPPLVIAFTFMPFFFALIHVTWSSAATCYSHSVQSGRTLLIPKIFNIFFIGALTLVPLSLIPTTLVMNYR